ncbi:MAG: cobyric acid synthase [Nitrospira sp.]|nr:cobyric acid synthase [Nitrospira sp.]MBH0181721.1 cobyric acid synthase [Nitrospira sp.]MBH0186328.1 cobyric acid synthase [Nitrospira sp.]
MKARAIAVLGTGSDVGKSIIAAGLCRLIVRAGMRVAPFKAQNMSNNSYVTKDGKEIGRAQALQAQACRLDPHTDMNPILLKPESDRCAQIVVQGTVWGKSDARDYWRTTTELAERVKDSYERLAQQFEVIVIEGAGSAAEMNLRDRDLANWAVVEHADAHVVLVADIDRGGVFAQVVGTLDLIALEERARVIGVIVNKFRGDQTLFDDGIRFLESRTGLPVLGVVPMLPDLSVDQEDSVAVERARQMPFDSTHINIAVVLLRRMSNFTDFKHVALEGDVRLRYVERPQELAGADIVIIPGSKNTLEDLCALRQAGFQEALHRHVDSGGELIGICAGFQMLGRRFSDPEAVESDGEVEGFGLLDVLTVMMPVKTTRLIEAQPLHIHEGGLPPIQGYYIHMGVTHRGNDGPCFQVSCSRGFSNPIDGSLVEVLLDGAVNCTGLVWGTYIHGVFDQFNFRRAWLNRIRRRKGWEILDLDTSESVSRRLDGELDRWADHVAQHLDLQLIFRWVGYGHAVPDAQL